MKNGKYTARRTSGTKVFALLLSLVLVMGCAIGGTLAWLTAETQTVTNTFTVGDINIDLKEHEYVPATNTLGTTEVTSNNNYKMVPGYTMPKDPFVTVVKGSEDCYVFVKVEKKNGFDDFMTYSMADGWTQLTDSDGKAVDGVYYRSVSSNAEKDQEFYILSAPMGDYDQKYSDGYVTVKDTVTKTQLEAAKTKQPTISFTAYAIQKNKSNNSVFSAYEAWTTVSGAASGSTT